MVKILQYFIMKFHWNRYVCFTLDLTIATRIIAAIGMTISVILLSVFLNDKYADSEDNYMRSRRTALAFGLDWKHFHKTASTSVDDDPEGKMITVIVLFYSVAFLLINILLFFASIKGDWYFAIPWLVCEFLGSLSKFGALLYHLHCDPYNLGRVFVVGSIVYVAVMMWWWLVVLLAMRSWKIARDNSLAIKLETYWPSMTTPKCLNESGNFHRYEESLIFNSPRIQR